MGTGGHMATSTDSAVLTLAQWFSPAYPIGAFAYSHGLEWAIDAGAVSDAAGLEAWIADVLDHGSGRADALFLAAAYQAPDKEALAGVDATARAFQASAERVMETDLQGAAFCAVTGAVWQAELAGLTYPVAAGRAARLAGLPQALTAAMFLQAFAANLVSVGVRLIPIGQTDGQRLIAGLAPLCQRLADETANGDLSDLTSTSYLADIATMRHETQHSRVFRT